MYIQIRLGGTRLENKAKRVNMTDFDRFKLRKAKAHRNKIIAKSQQTNIDFSIAL